MLKNAIWLFAVAVIALLIFLPSYTQMQDLRQKNIDYAQKIVGLKDENARLAEENRKLEKDPAYIEKVGREKMGLIREGEVVYQITPMNQVVEEKRR